MLRRNRQHLRKVRDGSGGASDWLPQLPEVTTTKDKEPAIPTNKNTCES